MKTVWILTKRNIKLFFKDKGMFFTSLITPLILLVLYVTFLGNVYRDAFTIEGYPLSEKLINGLVGGQLFSSLLAVSCVTVAFCSNFLMVQDKVSGSRDDLTITPVKHSTMALGYYFASAACTLIICLITVAAGCLYLSQIGWYLSFVDLLLIIADVFLLVMFGTALSSVINYFLHSQGQISAVGTIVSSCYGFICGAYMPISTFSKGLQNVLGFLPGTYGTALLRQHAMRSAFDQMEVDGIPLEIVDALKDAVDFNVRFFDTKVSEGIMFLILGATVLFLIGLYILINYIFRKKNRNTIAKHITKCYNKW